MNPVNERFLSSEDQDLQRLDEAEFWAWWRTWFAAAQASNEDDAHVYSHGVFTTEPGYEHLAERRRWS